MRGPQNQRLKKGRGCSSLWTCSLSLFPPSEEVVSSPDHEEQAELILPLKQNTQIVIQPTGQPQRHWESEEVRERSGERFTPIKTSQGRVTAPRESNRCARHSDKPAAAQGGKRIWKYSMPSLKRKKKSIKFLCKKPQETLTEVRAACQPCVPSSLPQKKDPLQNPSEGGKPD